MRQDSNAGRDCKELVALVDFTERPGVASGALRLASRADWNAGRRAGGAACGSKQSGRSSRVAVGISRWPVCDRLRRWFNQVQVFHQFCIPAGAPEPLRKAAGSMMRAHNLWYRVRRNFVATRHRVCEESLQSARPFCYGRTRFPSTASSPSAASRLVRRTRPPERRLIYRPAVTCSGSRRRSIRSACKTS
jgi:hypothetical protein